MVHIEAGLRSFNKAMPEEINRIAADHMSSLLFVPTHAGMQNLEREGFELKTINKATPDHPNVYHCGDIMYDNSLHFAEISTKKSQILKELNLVSNAFILCTIHRDSNTDDPASLQGILKGLLELIDLTGLCVVLPIHPRTKNKIQTLLSAQFQEKLASEARLIFTAPASFLDMIALEQNAKLIVTDSGGVQKEAYFFAKPCVILREQTEWIEIVQTGAAVLTGADTKKIVTSSQQLLSKHVKTDQQIFGDGHAAEFICQKIISDL